MKKDLWRFTVPVTDDKKIINIGNYQATRFSGYYNGNKTSWQVIKVIWITGDFPKFENLECYFADNVIKKLNLTSNKKYGYSVSSCIGSAGGFCFVEIKDYGHMSKIEARKLMNKLYEEDNYQTVSYECCDLDVTQAIKHITQKIKLSI